jgi:ribonuclease P protein component
MASPLSHPRVGVVVPKRGRTTVDRNRLRRRLRELLRLYVLPTVPPTDLIVRVRDNAYTASFADLRSQLLQAVQSLTRALQQPG